jgi:hypothetical protein
MAANTPTKTTWEVFLLDFLPLFAFSIRWWWHAFTCTIHLRIEKRENTHVYWLNILICWSGIPWLIGVWDELNDAHGKLGAASLNDVISKHTKTKKKFIFALVSSTKYRKHQTLWHYNILVWRLVRHSLVCHLSSGYESSILTLSIASHELFK